MADWLAVSTVVDCGGLTGGLTQVKFPFDGETRLQAKQAVLKAALNASTGVQHNLALYRRAKTLDASARAKGYWL